MSRVLPILFNTEMTRAILDGRKTVTRRLVKKSQCMLADRKEPHELDRKYAPFDGMTDAELVACTYRPPYQPGDILYVRETWGISNFDYDEEVAYIVYKASENEKDEGCLAVKLPNDKFEKLYDSMSENSPEWRPSIHMPREAARIWLKVTDVRVERLHDMSGQDILREGVNCHVHPEADYFEGNQKMMFEELWNSTLKKGDLESYGWDANPWVWVIEFERCAESTFAMSAAMPSAQDAAQPLLIPHDYRNVKVADGMTTTIDLEDLKKQLGESHFRQIGLNYGV